MWCPNPRVLLSRTKDLGSQFICWWDSLHFYWSLPQTLPWQPNPLSFVVLGSVLTHPLFFFSLKVPLSLSLSLSLCMLAQKEPPTHSSSLLFYSLPLVGVQIITFSSVPTQSHFCLESQGKWFILRILLKLIPNAK